MSSTNNPLVSIIIPSFKRDKQLNRCIESIKNCNYSNLEIIIVLDGNPRSKNFINDETLSVIINGSRKGLAFSRNKGIEISKGNYILFVDDDNVIGKKMINNLVKSFIENPKIGMASPLTFYLEDKKCIWFAGAKMNTYTSKFNFFYKDSNFNHFNDKQIQTDVVHNCFMVKKQLFETHGNFDESLFVSGTELDLCFRAKSNYSIYVDTKAKCYHDIPIRRTKNLLRTMGFIDKKRAFYGARNKIIIINRYASKAKFFIFSVIFLPILFFRNIFIFTYYRKPTFVVNYTLGIINGFLFLIKK